MEFHFLDPLGGLGMPPGTAGAQVIRQIRDLGFRVYLR